MTGTLVSVSELRANLAAHVATVAEGRPVYITHNGRLVAVMAPPKPEDRKAAAGLAAEAARAAVGGGA